MMYYADNGRPDSITIRAATAKDEDALRRLAQRDTRRVPEGKLLIALVGGTPRAAVSLAGGDAIADPFHRTRELVRLLELRRSELRRGMPRPLHLRRRFDRLVPARQPGARAADAPRSAAC